MTAYSPGLLHLAHIHDSLLSWLVTLSNIHDSLLSCYNDFRIKSGGIKLVLSIVKKIIFKTR